MKINWEYILQNKFNYLLMTQIIILIAYPIFHSTQAVFPIMPLLLLIAITPALWVGLSRKIFLSVISVGVLAFIFNVIAAFDFDNKNLVQNNHYNRYDQGGYQHLYPAGLFLGCFVYDLSNI